MTDPVADTARAAAATLAPDLGPGLPTEVETVLHARNTSGQQPGQYDPTAIAGLGIAAASLIVTIAQLAWSIVTDRRRHTEPSPGAIARQVRITLREQDIPLSPGTGRITDVVIAEIVRLEARPLTKHKTPNPPQQQAALWLSAPRRGSRFCEPARNSPAALTTPDKDPGQTLSHGSGEPLRT